MKIKYRITLLFTVLVVAILLLLCFSVYYISEYNRNRDFRSRLRNRALTTARLLTRISEIDKDLLRRIDESTLVSLEDKNIRVYDSLFRIIYSYSDDLNDTLNVSLQVLQKATTKGEQAYAKEARQVLALRFEEGSDHYIVVAAAYDGTGITKIKQLKFILIFCFLAGSLLTLLTGYYFSVKLVKPISAIIDEVNEISSQNLSTRIKAGSGEDELQLLARTFNQLLDRLQESFDIQRRFISNASHELSTPLASVSSQLEVSLQKRRSAGEYEEVLRSVNDDIQQMNKLTRSLLEIAKAGSQGGIELNEVRIDEVLIRLPADVKKIHPDYEVQLNFQDFPEDEKNCTVFGNGDLLYSAFKNIIENACKYSVNKSAKVFLYFQDGEIKAAVSDEGVGIPEEELDSVFQPFYRGGNVKTTYGFGLGLSLANRIIRLHKGRIEVASVKEGGSVFTVVIPSVKLLH
ncbi:MAG: HAMP domain-containing sensor histidine kinase [Chitinophagaceae bacterium]|nr:HAMP domain-containing sensor histidine kinase [Chitinophagaceae bacterium]